MISLAVVFVLGVFAQQTIADEPEAIVGGTVADPGEFPHMCSLRKNGEHHCGCSIIGDNKILTAAHCVDRFESPYNNIKVATGTNSISGGKLYSVKNIYSHPSYSRNTLLHDVAVIILEKKIEFDNKYVKKIALPSSPPVPWARCQLSGWGRTGRFESPSSVLLKMTQAIIDQDYCANAHKGGRFPVTQDHVCGYSPRGLGACHSDSGGPFICNRVQYGITSWGTACAHGDPDVYTSVYHHRSWIDSNN